MTLQSSGAISFSQLQTEFGGANPISLSEYYAGGANVPSGASGINGAIPSSGAITMNKFYGSSDIFTSTMTVGSGTYTVKVVFYVDGFIGAGSNADALAPTIGSMSPVDYNGSTIKALYWTATGSHGATNGNVYIEVSGNRSAGFINDVKVDGVSQGTVGAPTYYSTQDTTRFSLGTVNARSNPFGTSGSKTITVA